MDRTYYAIVPRGTNEPAGIFYKHETADELDLVGLDRTTGAWESMPTLFEFFMGDGSGDRAAKLSPLQALKVAKGFGATLPASGHAELAALNTEDFHGEDHNEKDHGRRGVNKVTKKGDTGPPRVFTVQKKGSTGPVLTSTVKKRVASESVEPKKTASEQRQEADLQKRMTLLREKIAEK